MADVTRAPGRPRDASIDSRVLVEAIRLFGAKGWAGFSVEKVAASSGVGKPAIYLRWASKEDLLLAAIMEHIPHVEDVDTGSLAQDLHNLTRQLVATYTGEAGPAVLQMNLESTFNAKVTASFETLRTEQIAAARRILSRATARGELAPGTPIGLVLNVLNGGALSYAISAAPAERERIRAAGTGFADHLVGFVLAALGAGHATARESE
jgi:AcrR family transcriptional regulator